MDSNGNLSADGALPAAPPEPKAVDNLWARVQRIPSEIASVPIASDIKVEPDKLLQAARIIQDVLDTHGEWVLRRLDELTIDAPGHDRMSTKAAKAWNDWLVSDHDSFANRVREYLHSLRNLVANLAETARAHDYSEEQIHSALRRVTVPDDTEY